MAQKYGDMINAETLVLYTTNSADIYYVLKKSTDVDAMYRELGRLPLCVFRKLRMIKYWIRIVENYDSNSLVCKTYNMMYQEVTQGRANVSYNWAAQIKHMLDESGFTYVWNNQFDVLPNFSEH